MGADLFTTTPTLRPPVTLIKGWAAVLDSERVRASIPWRQYEVQMYGRRMPRPRLECWYNDNLKRGYTFGGGAPVMPIPLDGVVGRIRQRLEEEGHGRFDSCFANLYRDGRDSIGWHADDDDWIGPIIASVSFGGGRRFLMRHKDPERRSETFAFELGHGDLLIMGAGCQAEWQHCVPKTKKHRWQRINLTYRTTLEVSNG